MICVASIPHSGTHFITELIGLPIQQLSRCGEAYMQTVHTYPGASVERITKMKREGFRIVSPLRHPMAIAQSWANRGKPVAGLGSGDRLVDVLRCMIDEVSPMVDAWLPLDAPERETFLVRLSRIVGRDLKTDWAKRSNVDVPRNAIMPESDTLAILDILQDPFWRRFSYGIEEASQQEEVRTGT